MNRTPRVAFFTDTYDEINGVALTSRELEAFAVRRGYPFLCVRGGTPDVKPASGSQELLLKRSSFSFGLDRGLIYDPLLWRHYSRVKSAVRSFAPDVIHVVSPGDVSQIGVALSLALKIPLVISWHTNLHEFGGTRLHGKLRYLPQLVRDAVCRGSEKLLLSILLKFYCLGRVLFAPNQELISLLTRRTGRPARLMTRGVDLTLFHPSKRRVADDVFRIGFVGRITPEKSVRVFAKVEQALLACGLGNFRFLIVGDGSELEWLKKNLRNADFPGVLRGEELAAAYADMDIFLFPSRTDTFGNVVQEAMASGVPPVVTDAGGPKFIVRDDVSGCISRNEVELVDHVLQLIQDRDRLSRMRRAALEQMAHVSWDRVFEGVYEGYLAAIHSTTEAESRARELRSQPQIAGRP